MKLHRPFSTLRKSRIKTTPPTARGRGGFIASMVKRYGWTRGAEIGVFKGDTFFYLLDTCPNLHMVGVDAWTSYPGKERQRGGHNYREFDMERIFMDVFNRISDYRGRASICRGLSIGVESNYANNYFDFIFIDGDHTFEGVADDIFAWTPKVKPDGWIIGHDYNLVAYPGIVNVVTETFPNADIIQPDDMWACPRAESIFV